MFTKAGRMRGEMKNEEGRMKMSKSGFLRRET
jgi:hypothetical protein